MLTESHFDALAEHHPSQMNLPSDPDSLYQLTRRNVVRLLHIALERGNTLRDISKLTGVSVPTLSRLSSKPRWCPTVGVMRKVYFALVHDYANYDYQYQLSL